MSNPNDGGPAFPMGAGVFAPSITNTATLKASGMNSAAIHVEGRYPHDGQTGMSLRAYAAIKLRVPESGIDWLDAMIVKARRDEFAGQAMEGLLAYPGDSTGIGFEDWAKLAYKHVDSMLAAREGGK